MAETATAEPAVEARDSREKKTFSKEILGIVEAIKGWNILQLKEFKECYEETFGVTAAAPMMAMMPGMMPGGAGGGEAAEEKTTFDVVLESAGEKKIQVIKAVRAHTSLGLKEAKDLVEGAPKPVKEGVSKEEAEAIKKEIEEAGGTVSLK